MHHRKFDESGDASWSGSGNSTAAGTSSTLATSSADGDRKFHSARNLSLTPSEPGTPFVPPVEPWPPVRPLLANALRCVTSGERWLRRLPIVGWARSYRRSYLYADFVAGLTVGLTAIPQGIAYAVVAGLEPQYGLYAELLASFVYCLLGSCRNVTIGPTAIMALMVQRYAMLNPDFAVLAAFCSGCVVLLLGMFNMGCLVQFISMPVTAGFTTAAALQIGSTQVKSLLGLPGKSAEFLEAWIHVFENIGETRLWDTLLGLATIAFLLSFKRLGELRHIHYAHTYKYVSLARNAFAVLLGTLLAYGLTFNALPGERPPFALTGPIRAGFPAIQLPPFSTHIVDPHNSSVIIPLNTGEMLSTMGASLWTIPFVAILEIIVVAKAFAGDTSIDATQELIALGICNILGAFVSSMPVTGSFTRTAVNNASGVRTPFGGLVTGAIVLLSIGFLTASFAYIPKATLAAVIIVAMLSMTEFRSLLTIWRTRRIDVIPFLATMCACLLLGLDYGIIVGIAVNLVIVLHSVARPSLHIRPVRVRLLVRPPANADPALPPIHRHPDADVRLLHVRPNGALSFSAAEHLRTSILHAVQQANTPEAWRTAFWAEAPVIHPTLTNERHYLDDDSDRLTAGDPSVSSVSDEPSTALETISSASPVMFEQFAVRPPLPVERCALLLVILDGSRVPSVDVTMAGQLDRLHGDLQALRRRPAVDRIEEVRLVCWRWRREPAEVCMRRSVGLAECLAEGLADDTGAPATLWTIADRLAADNESLRWTERHRAQF